MKKTVLPKERKKWCEYFHFISVSTVFISYFLQAAVSSLKQEYKEGETTLKDAEGLAIKVLSKTLDMNKLTPEKGSFWILSLAALKYRLLQYNIGWL